MTRILMVCLGNICRSPLAQGILQSKLHSQNFVIDSAGTAGYHVGNPPDLRSIQVASKHGLDISKQRCRRFSVKDFDTFDYIYAMDHSNYQNIIKCARHSEDISKVKLILNESHPNQNLDVPDPYYGENDGFETVYKLLDVACDMIANNLASEN